ncbi:phosphoesterase [Rhodohalobacter sp. SW132]|uniref:metallophosphoesterase n=1 Tax=Rhodohalobacter sp. SW132 TaxID=2293433 RepID=UPI000E2582AC|nr:metallophosphoesterase [Rhodohalobacter sp. SW132]REL24828.1 phosphoesterase [Rhodohalobacter sp. SW132]
METSGIDFIGDIHGYADELEHLLDKMGYSRKGTTWKHPNRIAFFVGDFIDRGPKIVETLNIVRHMVDSGTAKAVMGNHEYNAICFNRMNEEGGYLREHSEKNKDQHAETVKQFRGNEKEYDEAIRWFETLPLYFESDDFRVVHATWDHKKVKHLENLTKNGVLGDDLIQQSAQKGSELFDSVDTVLKGKELVLPRGYTFKDKGGHERKAIRMKWWESPEGHTYDSIAVGNIDGLPDLSIQNDESLNGSVYSRDERPVFFGHYWLRGNPSLYRENICCLDYSVAKGGKLVAYRFDGEERLMDEKLVYV